MNPRQEYTDEDIAVLELMDDPVWFNEFIRSDSSSRISWHFDEYQKIILLDYSPYVSLCSGRTIGKTVCIESMILHDAVSGVYEFAGENEILLVVPNKVHLDPIFQRLSNFFKSHSLLRYFVVDRFGINYSQHEIKLNKGDKRRFGTLIRCRIAGTGVGDANIIGLHQPRCYVDECVAPDTEIFLSDGSKRTIKEIVENRLPVHVWSMNNKGHVLQAKPIVNWFKKPRPQRMLSIKTRSGNVIECTANHKLMTYKIGRLQYCKAGQLSIDTSLRVLYTGKEKKYKYAQSYPFIPIEMGYKGNLFIQDDIVSISEIPSPEYVYDIEVADNHNYIANGVASSNSQLFPYSAWQSLQQTLISQDPEAPARLTISGVPNGMREKNVLYESDMLDDTFKHYRVSRLQSPRYGKREYNRDLKRYGGEEADEFTQLILGRHGAPSFSVFDRKLMRIEDYPVPVTKISDYLLKQAGGKWSDLIIAPDLSTKYKFIVAGVDAGFSNDPTIITVLALDDDVWRIITRVELRRITYPIQAKIINWLDNIYNFNMLTIDAGGPGIALGQMLYEETGEFAAKEFIKRLFMVDFQGSITIGFKEDDSEIRERVRRFTIQELQKWSQQDRIIAYSIRDEDMISELERVGFVRDTLGQPRYFVYSPTGGRTGDDHILASLLTWVYGYYFKYMQPAARQEKQGKYNQLAKGGWYHPPLRGTR